MKTEIETEQVSDTIIEQNRFTGEFLEIQDVSGFIPLLPDEWKEEFLILWPEYIESGQLYGYYEDNHLKAAGVVFSKASTDLITYQKIAETLFLEGYLYLGFICVEKNEKGKGLGSKWIKHLIQNFPNNSFWLAVEQDKLVSFYQKNGFSVYCEIETESGTEWVMTYKK